MADEPKQPPAEIAYHYLKSSQFRVVHCDGIIGGITPSGLLHFAIFSERAAIPQYAVYQVVDGKLGDEKMHSGKEGIVRELEVDVLLSEATVKILHAWLTDRLRDFEAIHKMIPNERKAP